MFFVPAKAELNVNETFKVRLFPEMLKEEPAPLSVHWLLEAVADEPGLIAAEVLVPALV
jgi:hypothetical protein